MRSLAYGVNSAVRAERRLGQELAKVELNKGTVLGGTIVVPPGDAPKLDERRLGEELARLEKAQGQLLRGTTMQPRGGL